MRQTYVAVAALLSSLAVAQTAEQESDSNYRETYAIVGARIEVGDGRVIEKGTIVVKNGRIAAVGPTASVPGYAYVIKGDGLVVYPGFIDAYTSKGLKMPEAKPDLDVKPDTGVTVPSSMREANRKGTTPELRAGDYLDLSLGHLLEQRKGGFALGLLSPTGGSLSGVASLTSYSGRPARDSVLAREVGLSVGFRSGGFSGYPATPLGVMAHLRQVLMDAQSSMASPSGPVAHDASLSALRPLLEGRLPALIEADRSFEITRAFGLADQFGLKPILVGGSEAHKQVAEIKRRNVPVILALDYSVEPLPKKEPPKKGEKQVPPKKTDDPIDVPEGALAERQVKWLERVRNAKVLASEGVRLAFSTKGAKNPAEFWSSLRRAVREGLPREAALKGLTSGAAQILGVHNEVGTIELGKRASLVVLSGDFLKEDSKVRYMVIDRWLYRPDQDKAPTPPASNNFFGEEGAR